MLWTRTLSKHGNQRGSKKQNRSEVCRACVTNADAKTSSHHLEFQNVHDIRGELKAIASTSRHCALGEQKPLCPRATRSKTERQGHDAWPNLQIRTPILQTIFQVQFNDLRLLQRVKQFHGCWLSCADPPTFVQLH